ncbi:MAG TPA: S8 family serine peptidase, partial [Nitriliruptorales bacterium]
HVVGVAPGAELVAVKVLDANGSGYASGIVAGIDYVTSLNQDTDAGNDVDVANMSLGGSGSPGAMEDAIAASVAAGVNYALAAGNSSGDVVNFTPAGQPDSITVSALADYDGAPGGLAGSTCNNYGADDTFASFSNYGKTAGDRVDIIAPGVCILSTVPGGYHGGYSGTSMAAPHVAGAAALLAASGVTPADIKSALLGAATGVWASGTDPDGSADPLLNVADTTLFNPTMVPVSDGGGGTDGGDGGTDGDGGGFTLSANGYKVKGVQHADLSWSGANSTNVDVYRHGTVVATTANDGAYTDNIGARGGGSYVYKVCEAGTTTCSNDVTVTF